MNEQRIQEETILNILEDIAISFDSEEEEEENKTSEQYICIRESFRGYILKDWEGAHFNCNKFRDLNKVLIVNVVLFYKEC